MDSATPTWIPTKVAGTYAFLRNADAEIMQHKGSMKFCDSSALERLGLVKRRAIIPTREPWSKPRMFYAGLSASGILPDWDKLQASKGLINLGRLGWDAGFWGHFF